MALHDLETTETMRQLGVNVPEPIEAFKVEGLGVLVMEYLLDYRPLSEIDEQQVLEFAPVFFQSLSTMHNNGVVHGDLRADNVLIHNDSLYFIDATNIRSEQITKARSYDLACAIALLTPLIGAHPAVQAATEYYSPDELLAAREFLDFVNIRPDHDFDAARVKGEVEKRVAQ
jgi:tRNA A-37 threonylcarbamoyl transferase component Bud32